MATVNAAYLVTWDEPYPGREEKALEYAGEAMEFWGKQAADGRCEFPDIFFTESGTGLWIVKGDRSALMAIQETDGARRLRAKGALLLTNFRIELVTAGEGSMQRMEDYATAALELGYAEN